MTHTSTEQPEALLKMAHYNDDHLTREEIDVLRDAVLEIRLLRARVQELEASQARVPLTVAEYKQLHHRLFMKLGRKPLTDEMHLVRAIEAHHGITQENQG